MQKIKLEILLLTLLAGVIYPGAHFFNNWLFKLIEFTGHVNWIYLPAFLRLANVLVLGPVYGSVATSMGVFFICYVNQDAASVAILNALASVAGPLISLRIFAIFKHRPIEISQLRDLIIVAAIYAVMNALTHHIAWAMVEPDQLLSTTQIPIMMAGDFAGACLGALLFAALVNYTGILSFIQKRADE
jgi:hypothetical protein